MFNLKSTYSSRSSRNALSSMNLTRALYQTHTCTFLKSFFKWQLSYLLCIEVIYYVLSVLPQTKNSFRAGSQGTYNCNPPRYILEQILKRGRERKGKAEPSHLACGLERFWTKRWKNHWQFSTVLQGGHGLVFIGLVQYNQPILTKLLITFNKNQAFLQTFTKRLSIFSVILERLLQEMSKNR